MKRIIIASDSFKGSLSSEEVARAAAEGVHAVWQDCETVCIPVADGGEGTAAAVARVLPEARKRTLEVCGPDGSPVTAGYLVHNGTAYIESAEACGLTLVPPCRRNAADATSYGLGELVSDAVEHGARHIVVGLGGSATCDAGAGMLQALGILSPHAEHGRMCGRLLSGITTDDLRQRRSDASFTIACDVRSPLFGPEGAAFVFAPQKGAAPEETVMLDKGLRHFSSLSSFDPYTPGSGAAGGLGYALMAYLGAERTSGIDLILDLCGFDSLIAGADLVITGEGRLDGQTASGKAPAGVLARAHAAGIKCIAVCGTASEGASPLPFDAVIETKQESMTLSEAMDPVNASRNVAGSVAKYLSDLV